METNGDWGSEDRIRGLIDKHTHVCTYVFIEMTPLKVTDLSHLFFYICDRHRVFTMS
jgi:hypothetical protein